MKKKTVTVLIVIVLVLLIAVSGVLGYLWYMENHIFIEGAAYPINALELDLREKDISTAHYDALHAQLPGCRILWNVPFRGSRYPNDTRELTIPDLNQADVGLIDTYFPSLQTLDASGCTDYALLEKTSADHPDWDVIYQVDIGGSAYAPDTASLELEKGQYDLDTLRKNLPHLPNVTAIRLRMPELTLEELDALKADFENIEFTYTVELLGKEYDSDTQELDLSAIASGDLPAVLEKLPMLSGLNRIELMNGAESPFTKADVKTLMDAVPQAAIHYTFQLFGVDVSTDYAEDLTFKNEKLGDDYESELREALDIMPLCPRIVLDNCRFSDELLAQLRDDYRGRTKIVWRVWFGENMAGSSLTDATAIRVCYGLLDSNCKDLVYCEDVVYMDIGHNEWLTDASFIAGMPKLRYLIISGSSIKTLEPFRVCKELKFLELTYCGYIDDLSPLADCVSLEMLNVSNTKVKDFTPLDNLPLTSFFCTAWEAKDWVSADQKEHFKATHPDCLAKFGKYHPYNSAGWRYADDKNTETLPYYQQIRDVFMYDIYPNCPNNVGWYYEEKTKWTVVPAEEMEPAPQPEETQQAAPDAETEPTVPPETET